MMSKVNFSDDFKRDAAAEIIERGHPVPEISHCLGVSEHSLYAWKKNFGSASDGDDSKDAEIQRLKRELIQVTEERDILKKPPRISSEIQSEIRVCC